MRQRVAQEHDESGSSKDVAHDNHCSESWVRKLIQNRRERGTLEPLTTARHDDQHTYDDADLLAIRELIKNKPDATLAEVAEAIGKPVHIGTVSRTLKRMNPPRKKSPRTPPSRTAPT
jgi:transposase